MDNFVTQGLVGLVFVLSVALWSRSSSSSSPDSSKEGGRSNAAKKKSKKKKSSGPASQQEKGPAPITPRLAEAQPADAAQHVNGNGRAPQAQVNGKPGKKKGLEGASKKKMSLQDFQEKSNEERVLELEREARGDAGEKDLGRDMIDKELEPEKVYKKVARIAPPAQLRAYPPLTREEGWESVGGKAKAPVTIASKKTDEDIPSNAWASSNPFAALPGSGAELPRSSGKTAKSAGASVTPIVSSTAVQNTPGGAGSAQTKKQRQNSAKAQAKKSEKEAMEAERLAKLAQHKRQVEAERMKEHFKRQPNASSAPVSSQWTTVSPGSKQLQQRTMPKATINEKGSLVWD